MNVYFVTDVHGSDVCFRKFINAAKFYDAEVLILGGDVTGKLLIPMIWQSDGSLISEFHGEKAIIESQDEIESFKKKVRFNGFYPVEMNVDDYQRATEYEKFKDQLFEKAMLETLTDWVQLAKTKLAGSNVRVYITAGNDDLFSMDEVLRKNQNENVMYVEGEVVRIDKHHEMLNLGDANETPWHTAREYSEDELYSRLSRLANKLEDPSSSIFNIHVPPIGFGLDICPDLDSELRPIMRNGELVMKNAGSTAVKRIIEEYQPMLGLHGHIHESPGIAKIGKTVCINPGSEYGQGVLRGVLARIEKGKLRNYAITKG